MNELLKRQLELEVILASARNLMMEGFSQTPGADLQRNAKLATSAKSSPKDLVTFYDKAVEEYLLSKFSESFPGEVVIGEETCAQNSTPPLDLISNLKSDSFWLLDPIDGTTNYARAYPFFCTTAAFCKKTALGWKVLVGGVYNPVSHEMFSAARGCGAFLNRSELRVSKIENPIHSLMITGFASERSQSSTLPFEIFQKITRETLGVRRDGSAALDLSFVAAGRVDAYWEFGLAPWDTAAGSLLVEESQGKFSDLSGDVSGFFRGEILATNGILHKWVINRIKEIRNESA